MRVLSIVTACVLVGVCLSAPSDPRLTAAASPVWHSPQQKFLSKQATGNFGCKVNSIKVSTQSPGELDLVKADDVKAAFSNVATLEWAHIAQSSFSSLDGRNDEKILGTPGGDLGEFIQAIHAYSKVAGVTLTAEEVTEMLAKYLKVMTREKFFYETDEKSYMRLAVASGCRNLHVADMGGMRRKKETFLDNVALPHHIGDPFIRFLSANATSLNMNPDYIHAGLAAFHNILWTTPSVLSEKLCYLELKGPHREAALVNIRVPSFCVDQGLAPMVSSQMACPAPVMINHPDAAKVLRREMVSALTEGTEVEARDVLAVYNLMAEENLGRFWGGFGPSLPVYDVVFQNTSPLFSDDPVFDDQ